MGLDRQESSDRAGLHKVKTILFDKRVNATATSIGAWVMAAMVIVGTIAVWQHVQKIERVTKILDQRVSREH